MNGEAKKNLKKLVCAGIITLALTVCAREVRADLIFENIPVITEPGSQVHPDIWGNYIVWFSEGNKVYDLSQRKLVEMPGLSMDNSIYVNFPSIYDNKIVWDRSTGYYDIDLQKMVYPQGLSIGSRPAIYDNKIVWGDSTGYYDLNLGRMVYPAGLSIGFEPDIFEDKIAWSSSTGYYDIDLEQMVYPEGLSIGFEPKIHNNKIVWALSTCYYDIDLQKMVYPEGLSIRCAPDIFEDNIVWCDDSVPTPPSGIPVIFLWDPVNGTRQITESGGALNPKIYNDIVVWMDSGSGNWDIYMAVIPEPATISLLAMGLIGLLAHRSRKCDYH